MEVEIIPWQDWVSHTEEEATISTAKSILMGAALEVWKEMKTTPIAMLRVKGKVVCKTTKAIPAQELVLPLYLRNRGSLLVEGADAGVRHPHSAQAEVTWPVTEYDKACGVEDDENRVEIKVQPEFNLPKKKDGQKLQWALSDHAHPFGEPSHR